LGSKSLKTKGILNLGEEFSVEIFSQKMRKPGESIRDKLAKCKKVYIIGLNHRLI
jgi:hypothetical protein